MTAIEWTDVTWNPTTGCDRVSPGCDNCYALALAARLRAMGTAKYQRDGDPRTSGPGFGVTVHPDVVNLPLRWRKPRRVFVNSMGDIFHDQVPTPWLAEVFAVMAATPRHTFQVLTKRHARMWSVLNSPEFADAVRDRAVGKGAEAWSWPLPNVWLGVSTENQHWADIRVPALLQTPAAVRFISAEPLLGPVNLTRAVWTMGYQRGHGLTASYVHTGPCCQRFHGIDWVIAGGESGPGARPMHPDWIRALRDQCQSAGVPFFFKQWGAHAPGPDGPRRVGKKAAGRLLDGRTWDEFPGVVSA